MEEASSDVPMADGTQAIDYAINRAIWGYNTGQVDRVRNLVIRYRTSEERADSKSSGETVDLEDHTGAGVTWSSEETNFTGAAKTELALVVGLCLPMDAIDGFNPRPTTKGHYTFDPDWHDTIGPSPGAFAVVRRLEGGRLNLYRLLDKQGGLCRLAQMPKHSNTNRLDHRIVFFSEWTRGEGKRLDDRRKLWLGNIATFIDNWLTDNANVLLEEHPRASETSANEHLSHRPVFDAFQSTLYGMLLSVSDFKRTGNRSFLTQLRHLVDNGTGVDRGARALVQANGDDDTLEPIRAIFHLTDVFEMEDAEHAADACEDLFPSRPGIPSPNIDAPALLELARGVRGGVLDDYPVREGQYRPIIVSFCLTFNSSVSYNETDRDARIMEAYIASLHFEPPSRASRLTAKLEEGPDTAKQLFKETFERVDRALDSMKDFLAKEQRELGRATTGVELVDIKALLVKLAETKDWKESRDICDKLVHQCFVRSHHACNLFLEAVEDIRTFLRKAGDIVSWNADAKGSEAEDDEMKGM